MNTCATNSLSPPTYVQFTENSLNGQGLPWWSNSWEFAFQCRGCGFDPGMETKIPRVAGQLSLHASTTESSLQSPCSVTRESLQASMKTQRGQKKKKKWPGSKIGQCGMLKWATVDCSYPANPLRGAPGCQCLHWESNGHSTWWSLFIERELAQGKCVYGLLGSGEWFWHICYGNQKGRSGRGQGGLGKRHMDEPTEVDAKCENLSMARWCLSESFCHKQGIKQAGRWYSSSSWC